jgi:hypothetical protein
VFLTTPPDGIRDLYAGISHATAPWPAAQPAVFVVTYHDFADDRGNASFGDELDASARFSINARASLEVKAAFFDGEDPRFADRNKFWLAIEYRL